MTVPIVQFIDDDERLLSSWRRAISAFDVDWTMLFDSDPYKALESAAEHHPHVVVCDMRMPGLDGISLLKKMREQKIQARAIVLTGYHDLDVARAAINECDVFKFFIKPCPTKELIGAVEEGLASYREIGTTPGQQPAEGPGQEIFESLTNGLIFIDEDLKIVYANPIANELLQLGAGLGRLENGRLYLRHRGERLELSHLLVRAKAEKNQINAAIDHLSGDFGLSLLIQHLPSVNQFAIFVSDPKHIVTPNAELIASVLKISPSEANLIECLVKGASVAEASKACGLSLQSGRTYLKRIFQKTGVRRQSELIALVYRLFSHSSKMH